MSAHSKQDDSTRVRVATATSWQDREYLHEQHVVRGWPASDIARVNEVDAADVRDRLKEVDLFQGRTHPPKSGLARKLWEQGIAEEGSK